MRKVAVIGGGPAGMIAAATAANNGATITLFERNEKPGKKMYLTGKGRCNLTNAAETTEMLKAVLNNPKFLYSAFYAFTNQDIIALIESNGVPTKIERGNRVFPESDKSSDVIRALLRYVEKSGVTICKNTRVKSLEKHDDTFIIYFEDNTAQRFDAVVIATGGKSYSSTGSTGDGYAFARAFGHTITDIRPSLIPLTTEETWVEDLQGLSLRNVTLTAYRGKKQVYSELGEMLFTHFGVSGPLVLTLSGIIANDPCGITLNIDLKPGLSYEKLDTRILSDFAKFSRKQIKNALFELLPGRMSDVIIDVCNIFPEKCVDEITRAERERLVNAIKALPLHVTGTRPIDEAIITRGGVSVKEIDPKTMQSKLVSALYFAGEIIDVDAQTGGYNLQIAYSTGYLAGENSAKPI